MEDPGYGGVRPVSSPRFKSLLQNMKRLSSELQLLLRRGAGDRAGEAIYAQYSRAGLYTLSGMSARLQPLPHYPTSQFLIPGNDLIDQPSGAGVIVMSFRWLVIAP